MAPVDALLPSARLNDRWWKATATVTVLTAPLLAVIDLAPASPLLSAEVFRIPGFVLVTGDLVTMTLIMGAVVYLIAVFLLIRWTVRALWVSRMIAGTAGFGPVWFRAASWIIPIVQLWMPYRLCLRMWRMGGDARERGSLRGYLKAWIAVSVSSAALSTSSFAYDAFYFLDEDTMTPLDYANLPIFTLSAWLTGGALRGISDRLDAGAAAHVFA